MQSGWRAFLQRVRRYERREIREFRRWIERTSSIVHLSVLLIVPFVIGIVTYVANSLSGLSYLLFPPLASGAYMLFANPEGKYASPLRFVGGLTTGAVCGWLALIIAGRLLYPPTPGQIHAGGAALGIFLTGTVTWVLDIEEPAAYSTALLTLFVHAQIENPQFYVLSVAAGSAIVAAAFELWHRSVYEQRARFLYESTHGDDHVLVPMRGPGTNATAMLGARLAAAHRAGKVVLLDTVDEAWMAQAERELLREHGQTRLSTTPGMEETPSVRDRDDVDAAEALEAASESVGQLEERANSIETRVGVPCEVIVAADGTSPSATVLETAREANCDLIVAPYEAEYGAVSPFIRGLFRGNIDVLVHRSNTGKTRWNRILVPVRRASDVAHNMVDFATRLAGQTGQVSVGTCIGSNLDRRTVDETLADLVEPFEGNIETRVSQSDIEHFLTRHGHEYDLVVLGASQDRSAASRLISPPTFERIDNEEINADIAIVDRH
jgi:nucleotide-binding universal stress UspA family protein